MARSTRAKRRTAYRKGAPGPASRIRDTVTGRVLKRGSGRKRPATIVERIKRRGRGRARR